MRLFRAAIAVPACPSMDIERGGDKRLRNNYATRTRRAFAQLFEDQRARA
jgi:hypothetical protein